MRKKNDQELMWESFVESTNEGPVTTGGPLGSGSSKKSSDDSDDSDEDDDIKSILKQCHTGDITADEAYDQLMELIEDADEDEDVKEEDEEKNIKRHSGQKNTSEMRAQFNKGEPKNYPKGTPKSVEGVKRDTSKDQRGI
jgi:hypothetical protein